MVLTPEQRDELQKVMENPASFGAFAGMIHNNMKEFNDNAIAAEIQHALQVRVVLRRMSK